MAEPIPVSDHAISLDEATDITARFQTARANGRVSPPSTLGFHRKAFDRILAQPGCAAIRLYPTQHPDGRQTVLLVGVDEQGNDIAKGELAQVPVDCPPFCDPDSPFMGAR